MRTTKLAPTYDDFIYYEKEDSPSLDVDGLVVERFARLKNHGKYLVFYANVDKKVFSRNCPYCKEQTPNVKTGTNDPRKIHDVPRGDYRVDVIFQPVRLQCKKCGSKYVAEIPGIDVSRTMTKRLLRFIQENCFVESLTSLANKSGVSIETLRNIMAEEITKLEDERKTNPIFAPRVLGIDEKHIVHTMRGTLVDVEGGLLLDLLENNNCSTMQEAIMHMKDWDTRIEVVTTDMNNAYLNWLPEFLPNATIVIDKFHVIQDIQQRISKTKKQLYAKRKSLINNIEDPEEKSRQIGVLQMIKSSQRLFNYSMESIVRDEESVKARKLTTITDEFPEFRLLRKLYYLIEIMYQQQTYEDAEAIWDEWVATLPPSKEKEYKEWCDLYSLEPPMFEDFRSFSRSGFQFFKPYILNYFKPGCRETNAVTEGLNKMIGDINLIGNGYSFRALRAKCLFTSLFYERTLYSLDMKTVKKWKPSFGMAFDGNLGSSRGETVYEGVYTFKETTLPINYPSLNIFKDNSILFDIIQSSAVEDELLDSVIDEDSLYDVSCEVFKEINTYSKY